MPSQYPYRHTIRNEYLGVSKVIRAMTPHELAWKIEVQRAKWAEQESRKRAAEQKEVQRHAARQHAENLKAQAEEDTRAAQQQIAAFRSILSAGLTANLAINWEQLLDRRVMAPFQFNQAKPDRDALRLQLLGPKPTERYVAPPRREKAPWWEFLLPFLRTRRLEREASAREEYEKKVKKARREYTDALAEYEAREREVVAAYNAAARAFNAKYQEEKEKYARAQAQLLAEKNAHNDAITEFRARYEAGSAEAVEQYAQMALERSSYPDGVPGDPDVRFDEPGKTLVINFWLPAPEDVPRIVEHRFVASRKAINPVEMKAKEFESFYDDVIHRIALRTAHEVFVADYAAAVQAVVFNGWVRGLDRKTGNPFTSCILSYRAHREQFMALNLAQVTPKECVRGFKGVTAGSLAMLAPVKPIMEIDRDDDRFVESKEVIGQLRPDENLAAMEWEDFEHLVRELFEKEFAATGGEVRVTQASRDRGVDAIAFDPDPIRGGKFVIQAKRYNMVVPVSAVRDLYGTMINEGAVKGILVTTSHFGPDSHEFANGKPITLISGEQLVYLFQKHGYNVQIATLAKNDPRRGPG